MAKYRITVIKSFGNFKNLEAVNMAKRAIKQKVSKAAFTVPKKVGNSYRFDVKLTYTRVVNAPANAVKQAVQKMAKGSKITVTKL